MKSAADGSEDVLNVLRAGEYFGENSLLEGSRTRSVSMRCATPVEILKLSKEDFASLDFGSASRGAAGMPDADAPDHPPGGGASGRSWFGAWRGAAATKPPPVLPAETLVRRSSGEEHEERSKLISFIRMVSRQRHRSLREGEAVFRAGDTVAKFYILAAGELIVRDEGGAASVAAHHKGVAGRPVPDEAADPSAANGGVVLGKISSGEGFGEMSLLNKSEKQCARHATPALLCPPPPRPPVQPNVTKCEADQWSRVLVAMLGLGRA